MGGYIRECRGPAASQRPSLLALQSGDRALHPDFYPGAEPIGPIPAPGFAAVSKSCLSDQIDYPGWIRK
jgi:hypothetical protein